jgi:hypothetical protein
MVLKQGDIGMLSDLVGERGLNRIAGCICCMDNATVAVATFTG